MLASQEGIQSISTVWPQQQYAVITNVTTAISSKEAWFQISPGPFWTKKGLPLRSPLPAHMPDASPTNVSLEPPRQVCKMKGKVDRSSKEVKLQHLTSHTSLRKTPRYRFGLGFKLALEARHKCSEVTTEDSPCVQ